MPCLTLVVEWCVLVEFCVGTAAATAAAADAPAAHAQGAQQHGVEDLGPEDGKAADHDGQDEDRLGRAELGHVGALRVSLSARCPRPKTLSLSLTPAAAALDRRERCCSDGAHDRYGPSDRVTSRGAFTQVRPPAPPSPRARRGQRMLLAPPKPAAPHTYFCIILVAQHCIFVCAPTGLLGKIQIDMS
jgi:hypothetical protein